MQLITYNHFIMFIPSFIIHIHASNINDIVNRHIWHKSEFKPFSTSEQALKTLKN